MSKTVNFTCCPVRFEGSIEIVHGYPNMRVLAGLLLMPWPSLSNLSIAIRMLQLALIGAVHNSAFEKDCLCCLCVYAISG